MAELRPAYYARRGGRGRDWWTLLHPPYTAWHLSYVCLGAGLAPRISLGRLGATLVAFGAAVGISAHAIDELSGRPLGTALPSWALRLAAAAGLAVAVALGVLGIVRVGAVLVPFLVTGPLLVVAYNGELFGGVLHNSWGFAFSWGSFPVLTSYVAQTGTLRPAAIAGAAAALGLSVAQRQLSTPARRIRRHTTGVDATLQGTDGTVSHLGAAELLAPLESALRALSWAMVALAVALILART